MWPPRPEVLYCGDVTCRHCNMLLLMAQQQSVTTSREYPPIHVLYFLSLTYLLPLSFPPHSFFLFLNYSTMSQQWPVPCQHYLQYLQLWGCGDVRSVSLLCFLSLFSLSSLAVICVGDSRLTTERQHMFVCVCTRPPNTHFLPLAAVSLWEAWRRQAAGFLTRRSAVHSCDLSH